MFKMWTRCLVSVVLVVLTWAENNGSIVQQYTRTETPQKIQRASNTTEQRIYTTTEPLQIVKQIPTEQPQQTFTTEQPQNNFTTTEPGHIPALHPGTKSSKLIYLIVFLVLAHIYIFSNLFICFVYETGPFWRLMVNIRAAFANDYQRMPWWKVNH